MAQQTDQSQADTVFEGGWRPNSAGQMVQPMYLQRRSRGHYNGIPVCTWVTDSSGIQYTTRNGKVIVYRHLTVDEILQRFN